MKRIFKIIPAVIILLTAGMYVCAAEEKSTEDNASSVFNKSFTGQKQVTDAEFNKTVEQLKERSLTK